MFQRLPRTLAQAKAANTHKNILNEIRQIIYYLYRSKEITKFYKLLIFINSKNSKASDPHRSSDKYVALWNLSIYYTWKNI